MPTVRLPGGPTLSYQEWGRPDGSVVLMLHGLTSDSDSWKHVALALGERFRVVAVDARGHGGSDWTSDYSFELMRDDVAEFMEAMGFLAAIVVGHSMGAVTAYLLAATRPELVRMLVLEEIPPPVPAKPPRPLPRDPDPERKTDWHAVIATNRWRNAPDPSWWELAEKITAPTLVIGGRQSHLPQNKMKDLANKIHGSTFVSVDHGHNPHGDQPSAFLQHVEPFIARYAK